MKLAAEAHKLAATVSAIAIMHRRWIGIDGSWALGCLLCTDSWEFFIRPKTIASCFRDALRFDRMLAFIAGFVHMRTVRPHAIVDISASRGKVTRTGPL